MMGDAAERGRRALRCPECGRSFSRRGLAGHRRLKHGVGMDAEPQPAAPLPTFRSPQPEPPAPLPTVAQDLHSMRAVLERIEARLERLEGPPEAPTEGAGRGSEGELSALRQELTRVFEEIARAKDEARRGAAEEEASEEARRAATHRLGVLRRRQAHILYRMRARENGDDAGDLDIDGLVLDLL